MKLKLYDPAFKFEFVNISIVAYYKIESREIVIKDGINTPPVDNPVT